MRLVVAVGLVAGLAVCGACAWSSPPTAPAPTPPMADSLTSDMANRVERMRGCWIAREGAGAIFLRLLTPEPGANTITGSMDRARAEGAERIADLAFARDGSALNAALPGRTAEAFTPAAPDWGPKGGNWMVYRSSAEPVVFVVIEATGETLRIMTTRDPGQGRPSLSPLYEANRDGCD